MTDLAASFPSYRLFDPAVPVTCLTPDRDGCFHRFYDTSPVSPCGRWLAVCRLAAEDRLPQPGDLAEVVLVDLRAGGSRVVATTRGADTQLGAQVQWAGGRLLYNDLDPATWEPFGVALDPLSGATQRLDGTVYMATADGRLAYSPCLRRTGATQAGYGVIVPPEATPVNHGAPADDGLWVTDLASGATRLVVSLADLVAQLGAAVDAPGAGTFYLFHVKPAPDGQRVLLVLRYLPHNGSRMRPALVTVNSGGGDARVAVPASDWVRGGHHPNWCPDSQHLLMNLKLDGALRFIRFAYDGSGREILAPSQLGSGHPTLHRDGRHLVTDAYPHEPLSFADGSVPIRGLRLRDAAVTTLVRLPSVPPFVGPRRELRVDPHPAWDPAAEWLLCNGCPDGTRRVYAIDLRGWLAS